MTQNSAALADAPAQTSRFQAFTEQSQPEFSAQRLASLRAKLAELGVEGILLPRADIFQGEYLPPSEDRLAYLTGFTGSAGFAIVLASQCALFVDGRYTLQAQSQVDPAQVGVVRLADASPEDWLARNAKAKSRIGYDPALFTGRGLRRFEKAAAQARAVLVALPIDPVAAIWPERPAAPATKVVDQPLAFSGESREDKLARLQKSLAQSRLDALLVSECPSLNWLFNLRAADVPHLPILRAFALVPREGKPSLVVDPARLEPGLAGALADFATILAPAAPYDGASEIEAALRALGAKKARIRLDEESAALRFASAIEAAGGEVDWGPDPLALMKAQKNETEIAGTRAAHLRDGAAMVNFLAWLARKSAETTLDEIDAVIALEGFRRQDQRLEDIAFPSISAAGPHAALPHYRVSEASNLPITPGLYLIDSGGQYRDGTTDITRTIAIGRPSREMADKFTRVLKGMIGVSQAVFPAGSSGAQLDSFARQALWEIGSDYDHGTGHGVGAYLSVHEGPQRLSKLGTQTLLPGMILSNEPGYYRPGAFGIRIENLIIVEKREIPGAERPMLGFETITFCPIDRSLIVKARLTRAERLWVDAYHAQVLARIGPLVSGEALDFLKGACRPL